MTQIIMFYYFLIINTHVAKLGACRPTSESAANSVLHYQYTMNLSLPLTDIPPTHTHTHTHTHTRTHTRTHTHTHARTHAHTLSVQNGRQLHMYRLRNHIEMMMIWGLMFSDVGPGRL